MPDDAAAVGLSTSWNFDRHDTLHGAITEILEMGVGLVEAASRRPVPDAARAGRLLAEMRGRCASVACPVDAAAPKGLADPDGERRARALAVARGAIATAASLRAEVRVCPGGVVEVERGREREYAIARLHAGDDRAALETELSGLLEDRRRGRDAALEALCRSLWELHRGEPGITFALAPTVSPLSLPNSEELSWIFEELPRSVRAAYWHDTGMCGARAALGLDRPEDWLDRYGARMVGVYLSDCSGLMVGLPPGAGTLDWSELRFQLSPRLPKILKVDSASSRLAVEEGLRTMA